MTSGMFAGDGMSATLAKQEIQYFPERISPQLFTDPKGRSDVFTYFQLIVSRLVEVGEVHDSELSDGGLFLFQRTFVCHFFADGVYQLELFPLFA